MHIVLQDKYNISVLAVNIEFMWQGLETGERRAFSESFQPFRAEPLSIHQYCKYIGTPIGKYNTQYIKWNNSAAFHTQEISLKKCPNPHNFV